MPETYPTERKSIDVDDLTITFGSLKMLYKLETISWLSVRVGLGYC